MDVVNAFLVEFVHVYKQCAALWLKDHKDYSNKSKREECFERLLLVYRKYKTNATVDDVKRKITSLRSAYQRERRKIRLSKEKKEDYESTLWWFDLLSFLNDHRKSDNADKSTKAPPEVLVANQQPLKRQSSTPLACLSKCQRLDDPSEDSLDSSKSLLPTSTNDLPNLVAPEAVSAALQPKETVSQCSSSSSIFKIWEEDFDELPKKQKHLVKKLFSDILYYASLECLHSSHVIEIQKVFAFAEQNRVCIEYSSNSSDNNINDHGH